MPQTLIYYIITMMLGMSCYLYRTNSIGGTGCKMQFEFKTEFNRHNNYIPDNTHPI